MKNSMSVSEFIVEYKKKETQNLIKENKPTQDIATALGSYLVAYGMCYTPNTNVVQASVSLDTALASVDGIIGQIKTGLIAIGVGLIGICTLKNIITNIESANRQKAISCLVDGAVITGCLFLVDIVIKAVVNAFGGI